MKKKTLRSPAEVRAELEALGIPIAEWARRNNLAPRRVYDVLTGRNMGRFGEAHRAAVLLGIKEGVVEQAGGAA